VHQVGEVVEFTVTDDGPGIAAEDRDRIFERFTTVPPAGAGAGSSARGGAGLGLSIAAAIVDAHRGSIHAEDATGAGARFVVRLPATLADLPTPAPTPERV